jgi:hypothetical protein
VCRAAPTFPVQQMMDRAEMEEIRPIAACLGLSGPTATVWRKKLLQVAPLADGGAAHFSARIKLARSAATSGSRSLS